MLVQEYTEIHADGPPQWWTPSSSPQSRTTSRDAAFHTWRSASNAATVAALGATHTDVYGPERDDGLVDGTIDGTENSLDWMLSNGRAPYATLNVALWPATGVLIANPATLAELVRRRGADASRLGRRLASVGDRTG